MEYPIGVCEIPGTSAKQLFGVIKDVLRLPLPLDMCRGEDPNHVFSYQCHDNL